MLTNEIFEARSFKKTEKRFVGVTVGDAVSMTVLPLYKDYLYGRGEFGLKSCLVAAAHNIRAVIDNLSDGFELKNVDAIKGFAVEFLCAALRHFDACMKYDDIDTTKREREYESIAKKIKKKNKV